jgi:hypothetical protein
VAEERTAPLADVLGAYSRLLRMMAALDDPDSDAAFLVSLLATAEREVGHARARAWRAEQGATALREALRNWAHRHEEGLKTLGDEAEAEWRAILYG